MEDNSTSEELKNRVEEVFGRLHQSSIDEVA